MVTKMAANNVATSCIGAQVNAFSTRVEDFVVRQERRLIRMRVASRRTRWQFYAEPDRYGRVSLPYPAREHRERYRKEVEHIVQALDADLAGDSAFGPDLRRLSVPRETVDEIEQREQNTAHEQHGAEHVLQRPQEVDALEKAEKEGRVSERRERATDIGDQEMKNKKTWTLK